MIDGDEAEVEAEAGVVVETENETHAEEEVGEMDEREALLKLLVVALPE